MVSRVTQIQVAYKERQRQIDTERDKVRRGKEIQFFKTKYNILQSKFQDSQGYKEKHCLKKPKEEKREREREYTLKFKKRHRERKYF